jgi:Cu/Ag efflux pump CusA
MRLSRIAHIGELVGPRQITREQNQRFITVQCNVVGRDIGSFVEEAQAAIARGVELPPGYLVNAWFAPAVEVEAAHQDGEEPGPGKGGAGACRRSGPT